LIISKKNFVVFVVIMNNKLLNMSVVSK